MENQGWQYYPARVFPPRENPEKPGLGNNVFLAKVGNNGAIIKKNKKNTRISQSKNNIVKALNNRQ